MKNEVIKMMIETTLEVINNKFNEEQLKQIESKLNEYIPKKYNEELAFFTEQEQFDYGTNQAIRLGNIISQLDIETALNYITYDEAYERIVKASKEAFRMAIRKNNGEVLEDKNIYDSLMKEFDDCEKDVIEFNRKEARSLISEGILDLNYAFDHSQVKSFRLAREK